MNSKGKDGNMDNYFATVYLNPWEEEEYYGNLIKFQDYTIKKSQYKETTKSTKISTTSQWTPKSTTISTTSQWTPKSTTSSTTSWTATKTSTSHWDAI